MTIEEAIQTAIQYEAEVRDVYRHAAEKVADPKGKRVCDVLADEEQQHLSYLGERLAEWRKTGTVEAKALPTAVPPREKIIEAASKLSAGMSGVDRANEIEVFRKALDAERKTSGFYRKMVAELPPEGQKLFERFVGIEDGHLAIVQAEIDSLTGTGAWFDVLEVNL
jgi:rubrerythrin